MKMIFNYDADETHFHNKGFALSLVLKVRCFGTRKWPIYFVTLSDYANEVSKEAKILTVLPHLFCVYFACYPPESSKIIRLTCIWSKFVDKSFHSSQKPRQNSSVLSEFYIS